ncbi:MAG: nickel pincer cofactor biosynthesis protein LarB [Coriobacteriia bacterium]|nr:nickel pincer cofactor biosynthesis protein LarB [Coriobacteriia bacterium]
MDRAALRALLEEVASGKRAVEDAVEDLARLPFADVGAAKVDHHRGIRCGFPEVVFCQGKSPSQVRAIAREILDAGEVFVGTRATPSHYQAVGQVALDARYFEDARLVVVDRREQRPAVGNIVVASAGTADTPVAEEAAVVAEIMGNHVTRLADVGVAGVHRLLAHVDLLREANVIVAVAGMEGALPSLIGGLVACPVIAVPTSVGYGSHLGGLAALLAMLNSCAAGIGVVNIDNGFGAAALASRINQAAARERA